MSDPKSGPTAKAKSRPAKAAPATEFRIVIDRDAGSPFVARNELRTAGAAPADIFGACAIQKFDSSTGAGDLSDTIADAQGWVNYLSQYEAANFWFADGAVSTWEYLDPTDDWQNTYGMDAVIEFYHSGHGGMNTDGVFFAPLGSSWSDKGAWARSDTMKIGNQVLRYLFWSTCTSVRVLDGQDPIKTWDGANQGLRMIFGYETTSVDATNYGSALWDQWKQGKSLSQAFMDASWYNVSVNQAPAVVAMGASAAEAQDRVFNERFFNPTAASKAYYHWRWYYAAASALARRSANTKLPARIASAQLEPRHVDGTYVRSVFERLPMNMAVPNEVRASLDGSFHLAHAAQRIGFDRLGNYDAQLARADFDRRDAPGLRELISDAHDVVKQFGLRHEDIVFDRVFHKYDNGGSKEGSGRIGRPRITETVVQFAQLINGLPVIAPGQGKLTVTLDNNRKVTGIHDSTRTIARLTDQIPWPQSKRGRPAYPAPKALEPSDLLAAAWRERLKRFILSGSLPQSWASVPGTFEVGYAIRENTAVLVARQEIEADFGNGLLKRFVVEEPIRA
jgi:hypothetical protein